MELFLMRHAEAEAPDFNSEDRLRSLTEFGYRQHQQVVQNLVPLLQPLDHLLASPFRRARQTADLTAAAIACATPIEETSILADDFTLGSILHLLQTYAANTRILCIGHEPHMSRLTAVFLDGEGRSTVAFQPGSVAGFTFRGHPQPGQGLLRCFLQPQDVLHIAQLTS